MATAVTSICIAGDRGHLGYVFDALPRLPSARVVGIHAADPDELESLRGRCAALAMEPRSGDDWAALLDDLRPQVAVVCGPFEEHAAMCAAAFERGCHVFSEKPVALGLGELERLRSAHDAAAARSRVHFAGMMGLRFDPAFHAAHEIVASGTIGEVRLLNAQKSYKLGQRPPYYRDRATYGGTIPWVGSHAIDWVSWFSGRRFVSVDARHTAVANGGNGNLESAALCRFELEGEVLASVTIDYLRPETAATHGDDRIRVVGTGGTVEVRGGAVYLTDARHPDGAAVPTPPVRGVFEDFLACAAGVPSAAGLDARSTFEVTEACLLARQSADERREVSFGGRV